jgi:hypothetical protein
MVDAFRHCHHIGYAVKVFAFRVVSPPELFLQFLSLHSSYKFKPSQPKKVAVVILAVFQYLSELNLIIE